MANLIYYENLFDKTDWLRRKKVKINGVYEKITSEMVKLFGSQITSTKFYNDFVYINDAHNKVYEYSEDYKKEYNIAVKKLKTDLSSVATLKNVTGFVDKINSEDKVSNSEMNKGISEVTSNQKTLNKLKEKLISMGYSKKNATKIIKLLKEKGAFEYSSIMELIEKQYSGKEEEFKKKFGFDLYINKNGKKVLNTSELLLEAFLNNKDSSSISGEFLLTNRFLSSLDNDNSNANLISGNAIDLSNYEKNSVSGDDYYRVMEGACRANDYDIVAFTNIGDDESIINVYKNGKLINQVECPEEFGHTNGMTYDNKTNTIYVVNGGSNNNNNSSVYSMKLDDLTNSDLNNVNFKKQTFITNDKETKVSGIAFDKVTGEKYLSSGSKIYKINNKGEYTKITKAATGTTQDIYANDGKIYVLRYNKNNNFENVGIGNDTNSAKNIIDIYNNKGTYEKSIPLKVPNDNYNGNYEIESISKDSNGNLLCYFNNHKVRQDPPNGTIITIPANDLK